MKYLVTNGCSFTAYDNCWPYYLSNVLNRSLVNDCIGSSDNHMIYRRTINSVNKLLNQGIDASDILVGVMWSGANRGHFHIDRVKPSKDFNADLKKSEINPYKWPKNKKDNTNWFLFTSNNSSPLVREYYKKYFSSYESTLNTYEHILNLQNYLKNVNINYFFCPFMDRWISRGRYDNEDEYIKSIINLIDWNKFVTTQGQWEWVENNCSHLKYKNKTHPGKEQNEKWVDKVLLPWLKENINE